MTSSDRVLVNYIILGVALLAFAVAAVMGYFYVGLIFLLAGMIIWLIATVTGNIEGQNNMIGVVLIWAGSSVD
jgi:hypothetical protein